jgi:hypothetical protein
MKECEGNCIEKYGEHKGPVRLVTVKGWRDFHYCENAIKEDTENGLEVYVKDLTGQG